MKKISSITLLLFAFLALQASAQMSVTLNVEQAGTLSTLIEPEKKYTITQLILTGEINSDDLKYIHEMAGLTQNNGTTPGVLSTLNVSGAKTIQGGDYYYCEQKGGYYHYYYSSTVNQDVPVYYNGTSTISHYNHYRNDLSMLPLSSKITKLYLPNTATELTENAFANCTQLTQVVIGSSVAMIRKNSFYNCSGLTTLTIPANVTLIEPEAFAYCSGMKNFYVNSYNTKYAGSGGVLYNKSCTELHTYPWDKGATFEVPSAVTVIGESAFLGDTKLTGITLDSRLDAVNAKAFKGCSNLTSLTIPNQSTTIGDEAFSGCSKIASLTIGNSVNTIGASAFYGCSKIPSVTIPESTTDILASAFQGCSNMTTLTLGSNLVNLGDNAFSNCTKLLKVVMPLSLVHTGQGIFRNCTSLNEVTIGANLMALKPYSFNGCSALANIHCHVVKPLAIVNNVFEGVDYNTCNLYVPKGTYNDYFIAPVWGRFTWINEEYYDDPNADRIYIDNFQIAPGSTKKVDVLLQNQSHTCVGFQCDIQLSTGLEFVYNEDNLEYVVKTSRTAQYIVGSTLQDNGILRVTGLSPNYRPLSGTSGAIFSFTVRAASSFEDGDINISNAKLSTGTGDENDTYQAPATTCTVTAGNAITPGDVNDDGIINVTDYVKTASYILEMDPQPFIFAAADLDENGVISVGDLVGVASLALSFEGAPMLTPAIAMTDAPSIAMAADVNGRDGSYQITINMSNNIDITAMQMDLNLPEGMTLASASLSGRATASHQVAFNQLSNGDYRLLTSSPACKAFTGSDGAVLTLTLAGEPCGDGIIRNIELATPRATSYKIDNIGLHFTSTTGVENMTTAPHIYSEGSNIVIESPASGTAQIVLPNGMSQTVTVTAGKNIFPAPASGMVIVKMGNSIKKLQIK